MTSRTRIDLPTFLAKCDSGLSAAELAAVSGIGLRRAYELLAEHRPDRPRKAKAHTSEVAPVIRGLLAEGYKPVRIAFLLGVSRAYVYKVKNSG